MSWIRGVRLFAQVDLDAVLGFGPLGERDRVD